MANTTSAIRAIRQNERRAARNLQILRQVKKVVKGARNGSSDLSSIYSTLDRAAKTNVIHWKKAARLKSQLAKFSEKGKPEAENVIKKSRKRKLKS